MPRARLWCTVHTNHHGYLYLRLYWDKEWKEGTGLRDNTENRRNAEKHAERISKAMAAGKFHYLQFFPEGNRASEFQRSPLPSPESRKTLRDFFERWEKTLAPPKVRETTAKQYRSLIRLYVLPTLKDRPLHTITWEDLAMLQDELRQKGVGITSINRALHHALRAMIRDARRSRETVARDLFDRVLWQRLEEDSDSDPDPYDEDERRLILDNFRTHKGHWYPFVYFQLFQGARPSEAAALRRKDVDLLHGVVQIRRSRVASNEAKTKTKKSRRTIRLHPGTTEVLKAVWPIHAAPDDYVFTTPTGAPIDQANFYKRIWLPELRRAGLRERPFYNTRHSYISYMLSVGKRLAFVSEQTGHSIRTLERHYAKYLPQEDDLTLPVEGENKTGTPKANEAKTSAK
jgi:integrase